MLSWVEHKKSLITSGPDLGRAWSGSKLFHSDTLMIFLKEHFENAYFKKKSANNKNSFKITKHESVKNDFNEWLDLPDGLCISPSLYILLTS